MSHQLPKDNPGKNPQKGTVEEVTLLVYYEGSVEPVPTVRGTPSKSPIKKLQP